MKPNTEILNTDCFYYLPKLKDKSVDLIICDPPYNITKNKWDKNFNIDNLMSELRRVIKVNGKIIMFGQGLFSAELIVKNKDIYRYTLIWEKSQPSGFLNAKRRPLSAHEDISSIQDSTFPSTSNPKFQGGASGCIFSCYPFPSVNSRLWICSHSTLFSLK